MKATACAARVSVRMMIEVIFAPVDEKEFNQRIRNPAAGVN